MSYARSFWEADKCYKTQNIYRQKPLHLLERIKEVLGLNYHLETKETGIWVICFLWNPKNHHFRHYMPTDRYEFKTPNFVGLALKNTRKLIIKSKPQISLIYVEEVEISFFLPWDSLPISKSLLFCNPFALSSHKI